MIPIKITITIPTTITMPVTTTTTITMPITILITIPITITIPKTITITITITSVPGEWVRLVGRPKAGLSAGGELRTELERDLSEVAVT